MSDNALVGAVRRFLDEVREDEVLEHSAALAYRFLFAIFPFAIFLAAMGAAISAWVGIGDPTDEILAAIGDNLPPDVARQIEPQLRAVLGEARPGLISLGAIFALWAATGGISATMRAMNRAYDVEETRGFVERTAMALGLTLLASAGILVAFVAVVGGSLLTEQIVAEVGLSADAWGLITLVRWPLVLGLVATAVALLFRFGPNLRIRFRWAFAGGSLFAVGWLVATGGFALYLANFANYANTYGALGGVVILMLWFYLTALMLLLAAEVTAMLARELDAGRVGEGRRSIEASVAARSAARSIAPTAAMGGVPAPAGVPAPGGGPATGAPPNGKGSAGRVAGSAPANPVPIASSAAGHGQPGSDGLDPATLKAAAIVGTGVAAGAVLGLLAGRVSGEGD